MKSKQLTLDTYQEKQISQPLFGSFDWMSCIIGMGFYICLNYLIGGWVGILIGASVYIPIYIFMSTLNNMS